MSKNSVENKNSRYVQGGTTTISKTKLGWWERIIYAQREDDINFTIAARHAMRPDRVAFEIYGQASLAWLVLQYNNIFDITTEFEPGMKIRLPAVHRLQSEILINPPGGVK